MALRIIHADTEINLGSFIIQHQNVDFQKGLTWFNCYLNADTTRHNDILAFSLPFFTLPGIQYTVYRKEVQSNTSTDLILCHCASGERSSVHSLSHRQKSLKPRAMSFFSFLYEVLGVHFTA